MIFYDNYKFKSQAGKHSGCPLSSKNIFLLHSLARFMDFPVGGCNRSCAGIILTGRFLERFQNAEKTNVENILASFLYFIMSNQFLFNYETVTIIWDSVASENGK